MSPWYINFLYEIVKNFLNTSNAIIKSAHYVDDQLTQQVEGLMCYLDAFKIEQYEALLQKRDQYLSHEDKKIIFCFHKLLERIPEIISEITAGCMNESGYQSEVVHPLVKKIEPWIRVHYMRYRHDDFTDEMTKVVKYMSNSPDYVEYFDMHEKYLYYAQHRGVSFEQLYNYSSYRISLTEEILRLNK